MKEEKKRIKSIMLSDLDDLGEFGGRKVPTMSPPQIRNEKKKEKVQISPSRKRKVKDIDLT